MQHLQVLNVGVRKVGSSDSHAGAVGGPPGLQSPGGLTGPGRWVSKVTHSHAWGISTCCLQEVSVPLQVDREPFVL